MPEDLEDASSGTQSQYWIFTPLLYTTHVQGWVLVRKRKEWHIQCLEDFLFVYPLCLLNCELTMENTVEYEWKHWKHFSEGEGYVYYFFYPNRILLKVLDWKHECLRVLYGAPEAGHGTLDSSDRGLFLLAQTVLSELFSKDVFGSPLFYSYFPGLVSGL